MALQAPMPPKRPMQARPAMPPRPQVQGPINRPAPPPQMGGGMGGGGMAPGAPPQSVLGGARLLPPPAMAGPSPIQGQAPPQMPDPEMEQKKRALMAMLAARQSQGPMQQGPMSTPQSLVPQQMGMPQPAPQIGQMGQTPPMQPQGPGVSNMDQGMGMQQGFRRFPGFGG